MPPIASVTPTQRFDIEPNIPGTIHLRTQIESQPGTLLDDNILIALTLNDVACAGRSGFFYWLPTVQATARRRVVRAEMLEAQGYTGDEVDDHLLPETTNADLLFYGAFNWTDEDCQRWLQSDGISRKNICQAQLNWHNGQPICVLPIYVTVMKAKAWELVAGPRLGAHDGALLVYRTASEQSDYRAYIGTLFNFRSAGDRQTTGGTGPAFERVIRDRRAVANDLIGDPNTYQDALLTRWAQRWFDTYSVLPNTNQEVWTLGTYYAHRLI